MLPSNGEKNKEIGNIEGNGDRTLNRLASVGQIAAGIAHEVKNPLTAVKGFLQLLKEEAPHRYVDVAYTELENAINTMQNLLHVSKPDIETETFTPIQLCSELESLLYLFQDQTYRVQIETDFTNTDEKVIARKNQLKKAIFNLLKNAFEAIPGEGKIIIKHFRESEAINLIITDTGVGIPSEKIDLLGTPFFSLKNEGTGMGLTQVFSTIYDHQGRIDVKSEVGVGTTFTIQFPLQTYEEASVRKLDLIYAQKQTFNEFFLENKQKFDELLIQQGSDVIENLKQSPEIDNQFLLHSAEKVVNFLNETNEYGLIMEAKNHGKMWAKHDLELILILDWFQMLRNLYWDFIHTYYTYEEISTEDLFKLERKVNYNLDSYVKHFSSSFNEYNNEILNSQRGIIDQLTVPVIPLSNEMAILPIVGTVDTLRAKQIQEKVLVQIHQLQLRNLIIDLSGVAYMDTAVVGHLFKIVNGISIQGCKAIITGIRPEITNTIVSLGIELHEKVRTMGTLQQAIEEYNTEISYK